MKRRVTLRDIAGKTGYHYSTVSLALRGDLSIPAATRKAILRAARQMKYRPDPMVQALAAYRQSLKPASYRATLAWFSNTRESQFGPDYIFKKYVQGARARAEELGYNLEEFVLRAPGMTMQRTARILHARGINGILIAPQPHHRVRAMLHMDWGPFSGVAFGYSLAWPPLHCVSSHHSRAVKTAVRKLISLGYRRIGLVVGRVANGRVDGNWLGGYLGEILSKNLEPFYFLRSSGNPVFDLDGEEGPLLRAWLKKHKPQALIIDYSPVFIDWLARTCNLRVPDDIGIAGLSVQSGDQFHSGIDQNELEMGASAVDVVVGMLHTSERGIPAVPHRLLIDGTWRPGKTLRRLNSPSRAR